MRPESNPYQAYTDGSIFSDSPLSLVVALYEGALDATRQAETALRAGDIPKRTKAVNKAFAILTELLVSLDHKKGGEISKNLSRLYNYMQVQLLNAHSRQAVEPILEVASLLTTLLEGWREAESRRSAAQQWPSLAVEHTTGHHETAESAYAKAPVYSGYLEDGFASSSTAYSF